MSEEISIRGARKSFGNFEALKSIDLDVAKGEFLTLLGASGSGKSTLLMILAGFVRPDSGSIRIGGREIVRVPPHLRDIGVVFQSYALFPHMTVGENVAFSLKLRKVPEAERKERVRRALEQVQLLGRENHRVDQLSGGQRQRVAVARAIVFEPGILLMDEPLSALDKNLRESMQIELKHLHRRLGFTIIYVTHDQKEAFTLSDRIAVMESGRILQIGAPQEIYESPANLQVARFMGEASFLRCEAGRSGQPEWSGQIVRSVTPPVSGAALLMVRPERLRVLAPDQPADNRFEGSVEEVLFQGESTRILLRLATGETLSLQHREEPGSGALILPGQRLALGLPAQHAVMVSDDDHSPV